MKRLHVHLKVKDLDESIGFYSALFGRDPDKRETDYAKWLLDDPGANVSISKRSEGAGVDHVGLQFDDEEALDEIAARLKEAKFEAVPETDATCCYARSNKYWVKSPEGAVWELFQTFGDSTTYGATRVALPDAQDEPRSACCTTA